MLKDEPVMFTEQPAQSARPLDRGFVTTCALIIAACVCSIVVVLVPRPVQPSQLPALRVDAAEIDRELERQNASAHLAATTPQSPELVRLLELLSEEGLAEREKTVDFAILAAQRAETQRLVTSEFAKLGHDGVAALMNWLATRALDELAKRKPSSEGYGLLGSFPSLLLHYGYVTRDGRQRANPIALRVLYKQRLNMIWQRPLDSDLEPEERRIFEGWNALHAGNLPPDRRATAARTYDQLGGRDSKESLAIWLYQGGLKDQARKLLEEEHAKTGSLRLRNMLLYLGAAP